jgi:hypothetical protein
MAKEYNGVITEKCRQQAADLAAELGFEEFLH